MKDFIDHYESRGLLQNVEACVVHLDISSLDIHQVGISSLGETSCPAVTSHLGDNTNKFESKFSAY